MTTKAKSTIRTKSTIGAGRFRTDRREFIKFAGITAAGLIAAPAIVRAGEKVEGTLYVESWGGSYAEAVKNYIIKPYQEKYGIEVKHSFFGSNSEQLAKLKAGASRIDVSFLSDTPVYRATKGGLLKPINIANVPNYKLLYDKFKKPPYDPGPDVYCISYFWGDRALAYNEKKVERPDSWAALWNPKYKGRVAVYGSGTGPIYVGALLLGQNINNITDIDAIMAKLEILKPNLLKWWSSGAEATELLATGEVWLTDFWRGRVNNLRKEGYPIGYAQPKEGTPGWVDTMVIPKTAENQRAAEAFMNLAIDPAIHKAFVLNGINYAPTNSGVKLTAAQETELGASRDYLSKVTFVDPAYQIANVDKWTELVNKLKA